MNARNTYFELQSGTIIHTADARIWANDPNAKRLSNAEGKRRQKARALADLHELLKPGDAVFTRVTHVSRSGMSRNIECFVIRDNEPIRISFDVACALELPYDDRECSVKIGGCGMDMCFQVVYLLGHAMWPNGTDTPHGTRNGEPDSSGGYALKQRNA